MAPDQYIATAVQRGSFVYMYTSKGMHIGSPVSAGDGMVGFTASTVSIRRGSFIYMYDARGMQAGSPISAGR